MRPAHNAHCEYYMWRRGCRSMCVSGQEAFTCRMTPVGCRWPSLSAGDGGLTGGTCVDILSRTVPWTRVLQQHSIQTSITASNKHWSKHIHCRLMSKTCSIKDSRLKTQFIMQRKNMLHWKHWSSLLVNDWQANSLQSENIFPTFFGNNKTGLMRWNAYLLLKRGRTAQHRSSGFLACFEPSRWKVSIDSYGSSCTGTGNTNLHTGTRTPFDFDLSLMIHR